MSPHRIAPAAALLLALAACEPVPASAVDAGPTGCEPTETDDATFAAALALAEDHLAEQVVPGAAIAVVRGGEIEAIGTVGSKRSTRCDPLTEDSRFLTFAGMHFTATALMRADAEGSVPVTDSVVDHVPGFALAPPADPTLTTFEHVLTHTTAIGREFIIGCFDLAGWFSVYDAMPQWAPSGNLYLWQPINATIAAQALAAGDELGAVMNAWVFDPLGLSATYDPIEALKGDHATGHDRGEGGTAAPLGVDESRCTAKEPYQGLWSSIRDLAILLSYLTNTEVGAALLEPRGDAFWAPDQTTYSGLVSAPLTDDVSVLGMEVHAFGFGYALRVVPARELAFAVLVNANHGRAGLLADQLVGLYTELAPSFAGSEPDAASLASLAGTYEDIFGSRQVTVSVDGDGLTIALPEVEDPLALAPAHRYGDETAGLARDVFAVEVAEGQTLFLRFWRDEAGQGAIISEETIRRALGPPLLRQP